MRQEWLGIAERIAVSPEAIARFASKCELNEVPVPDAKQMEDFFTRSLAAGFDTGAAYLMMVRWRDALKRLQKPEQESAPGIVPADWEEE
jgi:hypothetical protein